MRHIHIPKMDEAVSACLLTSSNLAASNKSRFCTFWLHAGSRDSPGGASALQPEDRRYVTYRLHYHPIRCTSSYREQLARTIFV
jgi:hypothetical protein